MNKEYFDNKIKIFWALNSMVNGVEGIDVE
jgi:hypothetical protein